MIGLFLEGEPMSSKPSTKLHRLLEDRVGWDNQTWFEVERYLVENTSVVTMSILLDYLHCPSTVPRYFKTDMVKFVRAVSPSLVPPAWDRLRRDLGKIS